jgi:hypothetical protein
MSIGLTSILQRVQGLNTFFRGPNAGRETGVVLSDLLPAAVGGVNATWSTDGFGNVAALVPNATLSTPGVVKPDGSTITISNGVISGVGGSSGMTLIQALNGSGTSNTVTFSAIPGTFTHLLLVANVTSENAASEYLEINFNGDVAGNYSYITTLTINTTPTTSSARTSGSANIGLEGGVGFSSGNNIFICNYAGATPKSFTNNAICDDPTNILMLQAGGVWAGTAAITSITLTGGTADFLTTASKFSLYGMQ